MQAYVRHVLAGFFGAAFGMVVGLRVAVVARVFVIDRFDQLFRLLAGVDAQQRIDLGFDAVVVFLRARRADVEEIGQPDDLSQQLKKLGLPVLEGVA